MAVKEGRSFVDLEARGPSASVRMLDYVMDFCFMVEDRLEELGMSRTELAERLGKKPSSVTRVLSGSANITLQTIAEYDAALDLGITLSRNESRAEEPVPAAITGTYEGKIIQFQPKTPADPNQSMPEFEIREG